jgi:urea transport system substrate-binding protein
MRESVFVFPPFRLDAGNQQLWRGEEVIPLRRKTFLVLLYLVRNPGRLISKQELLEAVWPDTTVSEELLRGYIRELRQALGDDAQLPKFISTVPSSGYRFAPQVTIGGSTPLKNSTRSDGVKVGVLHSLTGMMALSEAPVLDATLMAIDEVNENGGVLSRRVEPLVADGESDESTFAREAGRLICEDGVCTIFGCWTSATRKAVLPVVEAHGHLLLYPTQYEGMEQSANIVYLGATPNQQAVPGVRWAYAFEGKRRFYLVGWDSVYSRALNQVLSDEVEVLGGSIAGEEYISPETVEVGRIVRSIVESKPEMILNSVVGDLNVFYTRALRAAGIVPEKIPTLYFSVGELELLSLSSRHTEGDYAAQTYFQSLPNPENQIFVRQFKERYGSQRVTADVMDAAYSGVHLWAQAVRATQSLEPTEIRTALRSQSFQAPQGRVLIDAENQHSWKTTRIGRIGRGGQFSIVWSSEAPLRPEPFPSSRPPDVWRAMLDDLYRRFGGHWTRSAALIRAECGGFGDRSASHVTRFT